MAAEALRYQELFGWPVGWSRDSVWLRLIGPWWALAVPEAVTRRMAVTGPAIVFPGTPVYHVFIGSAPTADLPEQTATQVPGEPMSWTAAGNPDLPTTQALTWTAARTPPRH